MASTTFINNQTIIQAAWLNDVNNAVYNGNFQASILTPTNLVCNGSVSGTGFTNLVSGVFASPGPIGNGTPSTGAFTTLTATTISAGSFSGTISGTSGTFSGSLTSATYTLTNSTGITFSDSSTQGSTSLGYSPQSWQNVTSSRTSGTTYTNLTGRPIFVSVAAAYGALNNFVAYVGSIQVGSFSFVNNNAASATVSFIVPANSTYVVTSPTGFLFWSELR